MPEGQFAGDRAKYVYESDDGTKYRLILDATLAEAQGGQSGTEGTGLVLDTPTSGAVNKPQRFKPRVVYWQGTLNNSIKRKDIVCGTLTAGLYASSTAQTLTIDGVAGVITGRRGEQISY